jgi:enterobacterial common antigen flippase
MKLASDQDNLLLMSSSPGYQQLWSFIKGQSFAKYVTLALGTNLIIALIGFLTGLLSARLLGPEGRGVLAAIQLWGSLFGSLAMVGMDDALVFFASKNPRLSGSYLITALVVAALGGIVLFTTGWFLIPILLKNLSSSTILAGQAFLPIIVFYAIIGLPHQLLRALNYWNLWNILRILPGIGWLIALLLLMFFQIHDPVIFSKYYLGVYVFLLFPFLFVCLKRIHPPFHFQKKFLKPMLSYGIPGVLAVLPRTLNLRLDQIIMVSFLNAQSLGFYVVAVAWSGATLPIFSAFGPVLFPHLSSIQQIEEKFQFLKNKFVFTILGIALITILHLGITPWLFPFLFGEAFLPAVPAALVLVIAGGINGFNLILEDSMRGMGYPRYILIAELASLLITAILLFALLPLLGLMGAAVASLAAYSVCTILLFLLLGKITK